MLARLLAVDALIDRSRPLWHGLGQLGVVVLGVHLAADRLDDLCYQGLLMLPIPVESPDALVGVAAWTALGLELAVVGRAAAALAFTAHAHEKSLAEWWAARSVDALVLPMFWLVTSAAGAWVVGMAVEDALAPHVPGAALYAGLAAAAVIGWRLGLTGLVRVVGALDAPKRRTEGLLWAPALVAVAFVAARAGLPIWGWL